MTRFLFKKSTISQRKAAFSLIELSIVVLIIGILIAGVTQGSRLVRISRLSTAQNQTQASPVNSIPNLVGWWETTSSASFIDSQADNGLTVTTWYDISSQTINKNNTSSTAGATYTFNSINGLPALVFGGVANQGFALSDTTVLNSSDYSIFVVESHTGAAAKNFFLCGSATPSTSSTLLNLMLGYSTTASNAMVWTYATTIASADNYLNSTSGSSGVAAPSTGVPTIHSFLSRSGTTTKKYFQNGTQATFATGTAPPSQALSLVSWAGVSIGCALGASPSGNYTGAIAEVIMFNRSLTSEERKSVEAYLGKKWGIVVAGTV